MFSRTCLQVCQTFETLRDTPCPLVVAGGLAAGQAGWNPQHKHQTIIHHQQPHQQRHCQHPFHLNHDHQCERGRPNICNILQPGLQLLSRFRLFPQVPLIVVHFCRFCCSYLNCARYLRFQESHRLEQESRTLKASEEQNNCSQ